MSHSFSKLLFSGLLLLSLDSSAGGSKTVNEMLGAYQDWVNCGKANMDPRYAVFCVQKKLENAAKVDPKDKVEQAAAIIDLEESLANLCDLKPSECGTWQKQKQELLRQPASTQFGEAGENLDEGAG